MLLLLVFYQGTSNVRGAAACAVRRHDADVRRRALARFYQACVLEHCGPGVPQTLAQDPDDLSNSMDMLDQLQC